MIGVCSHSCLAVFLMGTWYGYHQIAFLAESHKGLMISHCLTLALFPCARCQSGLSDSILTVGGHSILPLHWSWCVSLWAVPHTTFLSFFAFCYNGTRFGITPQKDLVLVEIWLLTVADSEYTNFICGSLIHAICILTLQVPSSMPNGDMPKKRHRNNQYWWRYSHLLLLTVVNSEQDILHSDGNHLHFSHSNMVDRCIYK